MHQKFISGINASALIFKSMKTIFDLEISYSKWNSLQETPCHMLESKYIFSDLAINEFFWDAPAFESSSVLCPQLFKGSNIQRLIITAFNPIVFGASNANLNIRIEELFIQNTFGSFISSLSRAEILNVDMFAELKLIEINQVHLKSIDADSIRSLKKLRALRLIRIDLELLLLNGTEWFNALNSQNSKNISDGDLNR